MVRTKTRNVKYSAKKCVDKILTSTKREKKITLKHSRHFQPKKRRKIARLTLKTSNDCTIYCNNTRGNLCKQRNKTSANQYTFLLPSVGLSYQKMCSTVIRSAIWRFLTRAQNTCGERAIKAALVQIGLPVVSRNTFLFNGTFWEIKFNLHNDTDYFISHGLFNSKRNRAAHDKVLILQICRQNKAWIPIVCCTTKSHAHVLSCDTFWRCMIKTCAHMRTANYMVDFEDQK